MVPLQKLYAQRFPASEERKREELWKVLCEYFQRWISTDATVLDLGAGGGEFINNIRAARRIAVDANPALPSRLRDGVEPLVCTFDDLGSKIEDGTVDVCFASNVFEHLRSADELLSILQTVRSFLAPEGRLIILQPNIRAVGAAFWDFVDHSLPLTETGMSEALRVSGFEPEICRARFLPYTTKGRLPSRPFLVRAYLRFPPIHRILGGQMLIVARPERT